MQNEAIHEWLTGSRNYNDGIVIYDQYGTNKSLKNLFTGKQSSFRKTKLLRALKDLAMQETTNDAPNPVVNIPQKKIIEKPDPIVDPQPQIKPVTDLKEFKGYTKPSKFKKFDTADLPESLKDKYYNILRPAQNARSKYQNELIYIADLIRSNQTNDKTYETTKLNCAEVVRLSKLIKSIYQEIDLFMATGEIKKGRSYIEDIAGMNYVQLIKYERVLLPRITRAKKKTASEHYLKRLQDALVKLRELKLEYEQ